MTTRPAVPLPSRSSSTSPARSRDRTRPERASNPSPRSHLSGDVGSNGRAGPFSEPALFYDPPYACSLDDDVAWHLVKYLAPTCGLQNDVSGPPVGSFTPRLDFRVEADDRRVGVAYMPAATDLAERLQDALLVGSGTVDVLYRFRRADVVYFLHDVLWLMAQWEPGLFSDRGRTNLRTLASPQARATPITAADTETSVSYAPPCPGARSRPPLNEGPSAGCALLDTDLPVPDALTLRRRLRARPSTWRTDYDEARVRFS